MIEFVSIIARDLARSLFLFVGTNGAIDETLIYIVGGVPAALSSRITVVASIDTDVTSLAAATSKQPTYLSIAAVAAAAAAAAATTTNT